MELRSCLQCGFIVCEGMVDTLQPRRFGAGQQPAKPANSGLNLTPIVDFTVGSHWRATLFLIVCAALLFLPGFFSIPADRP